MPFAAAFLTIAVLFVTSLADGGRVWGLNAWEPLPVPARFGLAGLVGGVTALLSRRPPTRIPRAVGVFAAAFRLLRSHAHFLGDGYQNLALLASEPPVVKPTSAGTTRILVALRDLFGGGESGALAAYRALSFGSGFLMLAVTIAAAGRVAAVPRRGRARGGRRRRLVVGDLGQARESLEIAVHLGPSSRARA